MSSTNKTTYYELPQFVDNDIFNPLVDDNDAYSKIDTALHNIADAEADDASEIVDVKSRLDSAESDIDNLEAQNGNSVLTTTAQTLSGAINELDGDVIDANTAISTLQTTVGDNNSGLVKDVNDIKTNLDNLIITNHRKFILIGDSYGNGTVGGGSPNVTGWAEYAQNILGNANVIYSANTGSGFLVNNNTWLSGLTAIYDNGMGTIDPSEITDIVVFGGSNDVGAGATVDTLITAIDAFCAYAKSHFPNAEITIGCLGIKAQLMVVGNVFLGYKKGALKNGCKFIDATLNLMTLQEYVSAGEHVTEAGYNFYNPYILEAIMSGCVHYNFSESYTLTLDSDITPVQGNYTYKLKVNITDKGIKLRIDNDGYQPTAMKKTTVTTGQGYFTLFTWNETIYWACPNSTFFANCDLLLFQLADKRYTPCAKGVLEITAPSKIIRVRHGYAFGYNQTLIEDSTNYNECFVWDDGAPTYIEPVAEN